MSFISKFVSGKEHKWSWFFQMFLGGAIPILLSSIISLSTKKLSEIQSVDDVFSVTDVLFWGLTMNLGNIGLVNNRDFKEKDFCLQASGILTLCLAVFLGFVYAKVELQPFFYGAIYLFVLGSIYVSRETNNFVYEHLKITS